MAFLWGKATSIAAMSAKLERLREAERVLIELAYQQNDSTNNAMSTSMNVANPLPPTIQPFDTNISASCVHNTSVASQCMTSGQEGVESYTIHGISITSQNDRENVPRCDKPLVLLHGYSK